MSTNHLIVRKRAGNRDLKDSRGHSQDRDGVSSLQDRNDQQNSHMGHQAASNLDGASQGHRRPCSPHGRHPRVGS
jgi:hypothetical protein